MIVIISKRIWMKNIEDKSSMRLRNIVSHFSHHWSWRSRRASSGLLPHQIVSDTVAAKAGESTDCATCNQVVKPIVKLHSLADSLYFAIVPSPAFQYQAPGLRLWQSAILGLDRRLEQLLYV